MKFLSAFILILVLGLYLVEAEAIESLSLVPFDERIRDSTLIFLGVPISDEFMKVPDKNMDAVVVFDVEKMLKGKADKYNKIQVYYKRRAPPPAGDGASSFSAKPDTIENYSYEIREKMSLLVYARLVNELPFTSREMGGGNALGSDIQIEIEKLKKLELTKSWWQRLF